MTWLSHQMECLIAIQNFRDLSNHIFDNFFLSITLMGEVIIPLSLITLIYWCINKKIGIYILFNYIFGFITNAFLKATACIYRPWIIDSRITPLEQAMPAATGYSFPSGHTAGAVSVWGSLAVKFWNNKFLKYICGVIILLVMLSRVYIGVHTPQDVIVSLLVGLCLLYGSKKLLEWEEKKEKRDVIIANVVCILSLAVLLYINIKSYPMDYVDSKLLFDPKNIKIDIFARVGWVFGIFYGWLIEKKYIKFNPQDGKLLKKIFRFLIGITLLYLLYNYGKEPFTRFLGTQLGLFVEFGLMGFYITIIIPFLIKKRIL